MLKSSRVLSVLALLCASVAHSQATFSNIQINGQALDAFPALNFANKDGQICWGSSDCMNDTNGVLALGMPLQLKSGTLVATTSVNHAASPVTMGQASIYLCDATAGAVTLNLPAANAKTGQRYVAKKIDSSGNACTLTAAGADTIDGAATYSLSAQYASVIVNSDSTAHWEEIAAVSSGSGITTLTGDVTASGSGSVAATVAAVGTSSASNVHTAEVLSNAATNANTASTIVKRDGSGNFTAGTITASLTGNASGSAASFTGSLVGDVTGTQGATTVTGAASASSVFTSSVASGSTAYSLIEGAKLSFNGATATSYIKGDATSHGLDFVSVMPNSGSAYAFDFSTANAIGGSTGLTRFCVNGGACMTVSSGGNLTIPSNALFSSAGLTDPGSDKVPFLYQADIGFIAPFIHTGSATLSTGTKTVTYGTAFGAAPLACICPDTTAANAVGCSSTASVLTVTGTGSDVIQYICVGQK